MTIRDRLLLLLFICSFFSCSIITEPEEITILSFEKEFTVSLSQVLQEGPNIPAIKVTTLEPPFCADSHLELNTEIYTNHIELHIPEIEKPADCNTAFENLENLATIDIQNGIYTFSIILKSAIINEGSLKTSSVNYEMSFEQSNAIIFGKTSVKVIPDDVFWGRMTPGNSSSNNSLEEAHKIIEKRYTNKNLASGDYGFYEIDNDGNLSLSEPSSTTAFIDFLFRYDQDYDHLSSLIQSIHADHPFLTIQIMTGLGEEI